MKPSLLSTSLLILASALAAGEALPERVPLTLTPGTDDNLGHAYIQIRGTEPASMPFATADGKLRFARKDDAWLVDRNGDGRLDDADLPLVHGVGDTFTVPMRIAGGTRPCTFKVLYTQANYLYLGGGTTLEATIGSTRLRLVDRNLDGRFDEPGIDGVMSGPPGRTGAARVVPLTRIVDLDGRLVEVAVVDDGAALTLKPYTGPIAQVTAELLPANRGEAGPTVTAMDVVLVQDGNQAALHITGPGTLIAVPGTYRIERDQLTLTLPPAKGGLGSAVAGALFGKRGDAGGRQAFLANREPGTMTLVEGANAFKRGAPDRLAFTATGDGEGSVTIAGAVLEDGHGGSWAATLNGADGTLACLAKKGDVERQLTTMEYG